MPALGTMIGCISQARRSPRLAPAILLGALAATSGLLTPTSGLRAQTPTSPEKPSASPGDARVPARPAVEPFDLSYLPRKSYSILAFRPSATFRREDMKPNARLFEGFIRASIDLDDRGDAPLNLEGIEQVILGSVRPPRGAGKDRTRPLISGCLMVRATDALDWKARIAAFLAKKAKEPWEWVNVAFEGRSYDKLKESATPRPAGPDLDVCLHFPDARTVVVGDEASLREVIRRPGMIRPDLAGDPGWQEVDRGLIAAACTLDDPKDETDGITDNLASLATDALPQLPYPRRTICGITEDETVRVRTSHDYPDTKEAGAWALKSIGELAVHKAEFAVLGGSDLESQADPSDRFLYRCLLELVRNGQVRCDNRTVQVASRCRMPFKELVALYGDAMQAIATDLGDKQAAAKPTQRVTR